MTGLFEAAFAEEHLDRVLRQARDEKQSVSVIHLRVVNVDELVTLYGHSTSDRLMRAVADRLREAVRHTDIIGRSGSDGFLVALPTFAHHGNNANDAERIGALLDQLAGTVEIDGAWLRPRLAAGVSRYPTDGTTLNTVLDTARTALRAVVLDQRESGFRFYSPDSHEQVRRQHEQTYLLAAALDEDALEQVYQPFIDIETGRITGFEALARWHDPVYGEISPSVFIPLAEADPDLRHALTQWSLHAACRQIARLNRQQANRLRVSVNLPGAELLRADFVDLLHGALFRHQVRPDQIILELTEQSLIANTLAAGATISQLRAEGVRFAVDDFGTGYSSLGYLKTLPLDIVKIDRCFIQDVADDPVAAKLTGSIVDICQALDLRTIAEGIETQAQLAALVALDCDLAQGFLFDRPMPAEALIEQLQQRNGWPVAAESSYTASMR